MTHSQVLELGRWTSLWWLYFAYHKGLYWYIFRRRENEVPDNPSDFHDLPVWLCCCDMFAEEGLGCWNHWVPTKFKCWQPWPHCSLVQLCLSLHTCSKNEQLPLFLGGGFPVYLFSWRSLKHLLYTAFFMTVIFKFSHSAWIGEQGLKKERAVNGPHRWERRAVDKSAGEENLKASKEILEVKHTAQTQKLAL